MPRKTCDCMTGSFIGFHVAKQAKGEFLSYVVSILLGLNLPVCSGANKFMVSCQVLSFKPLVESLGFAGCIPL